MYAMTAAHRTLPLPTYVRVRNLRNNKSIVVRVNDRGPFVHNRIIDLSYGAAIRLDMIRIDSPRFREHVTALSTQNADYENFLTFVQPPMNSLVGALKAKMPMFEGLDENGYILPGIGDCGDRIYGTK